MNTINQARVTDIAERFSAMIGLLGKRLKNAVEGQLKQGEL